MEYDEYADEEVHGLIDCALESRFENLCLIGKGSFGDVYRGFDKELNKEVAIKIIDLEEAEDEVEDIQKEISVLSQCRSPHIRVLWVLIALNKIMDCHEVHGRWFYIRLA